ncbi:MAG: hypothetical protein RSD06_05695 [Bacilli bacterium]
MDKRNIKYKKIEIPEPTYEERERLFYKYIENHSGSEVVRTMWYHEFEDSMLSKYELTFRKILK